MKALILRPSQRITVVEEMDIPKPHEGEVLIQVHAVALNPVDEFYITNPVATQERRIVGSDFSGIVVGASPELSDMADLRVKQGTRVAGFLQGASSANDRPGAFAEYITCPYDLLWTVVDQISLEAASTVSMCGLTAAQAVIERFGFPSAFTESRNFTTSSIPINVLINGASTSLGMYIAQFIQQAAQVSKRSIRLIGTASPKHHEMLSQEPYRYSALLNYREEDWPNQVKAATNHEGIDFAFDTVSEYDSVRKVHSTLRENGQWRVFRSSGGGQYDISDLPIQPVYGVVWEGLGVEIDYGDGQLFPAPPSARQFAAQYFRYLSSGVEDSRVKLHPNQIRLMPGGLDSIIPEGMSLLSGLVTDREVNRTESHMQPISGEKLVYVIKL